MTVTVAVTSYSGNNDYYNDNDDVSFDSSDYESIIYRMKVAERRRKKKSKSIIMTNDLNEKKKKVNHQLKPHNNLLPVQDDGIVEQITKLSTIVAVEANTVCEAATLTSQLQPVVSQQQ